jgi:glutaminyl-tRNA synthetase
VRLYEHLLLEDGSVNPASLTTLKDAKAEPGLSDPDPGTNYQFLRQGYFCFDGSSKKGSPVFNRTVTLKDTWAKMSKGAK